LHENPKEGDKNVNSKSLISYFGITNCWRARDSYEVTKIPKGLWGNSLTIPASI